MKGEKWNPSDRQQMEIPALFLDFHVAQHIAAMLKVKSFSFGNHFLIQDQY
jgi:hypothetical protein